MSGDGHALLPKAGAKAGISLALSLALAGEAPLLVCIEWLLDWVLVLQNSFNFQFTEVHMALTTVCFHSLSQHECVQFLFTLPNTKLALTMMFNVNHNVTVDIALR